MTKLEGGLPTIHLGNAATAIAQSSGGVRMGVSESVNVGRTNADHENSRDVGTPHEIPWEKVNSGLDPREAADKLERNIDRGASIKETLRMFAKGELSDKDISNNEVPEKILGPLDGEVIQGSKDPEVKTEGNIPSAKNGQNSQDNSLSDSEQEGTESEFERNKSKKEDQNPDEVKETTPETDTRVQAIEERLNRLEKRFDSVTNVQRGMTQQEMAQLLYEIMKQLEEEKDEEKKISIVMAFIMAIGLFMKSLAFDQDVQQGKNGEKKAEMQKPKSSIVDILEYLTKSPEAMQRVAGQNQNRTGKDKNTVGKTSEVRSDTNPKAA